MIRSTKVLNNGNHCMSVKSVLGDLQIVVERHSDALKNNSVIFRVIIAFRVFGFLVSFFSFARNVLWLHPYQLASIEVWRVFTAAFCGHNLIDLAWTIWSLYFATNLIRLNNSNESLLKLYAITQALTTLIIAIFAYITYVVFDSIKFFYVEPLVGLIPICSTVLVLMKQFLPDSIVLSTPIGRLKYTHLPFTAILISLVLALFKITYFVTFLQIAIGVQVSWTYLRFYKPHDTDDIYGDQSEHFTWASLFPSRTQLIFTLIGRVCFRSLAKLGVCKRPVRHVDLNSLQSVAVGINLPAIETSAKDSERRRQKALRELNDRLNKTRQTENLNYGNWDEEEEDDEEHNDANAEQQRSENQKAASSDIPELHSPRNQESLA